MKTPDDVVRLIERRLTSNWHRCVSGLSNAFPHSFPLGKPSVADMRSNYSAILALTRQWQSWAEQHSASLDYGNRRGAGGSTQTVPTHVTISSIDHAANIVGGQWPARFERARTRLADVTQRCTDPEVVATIIRTADTYTSTDFELLLTVVDWLVTDPTRAQGITPRQVPIPGVHAKWLQTHMKPVLQLTGLDDLGLLPSHPSRINFTYLDEDYHRTGQRVHDSATVGDSMTPAYPPQVVVISENKDTAIHFPPIRQGISVEGVGRGGKTLASFPWLRDAPLVIYWGDMDRDGYEILDGYRRDFDRDLESIFMDVAAYDEFEPFGTSSDRRGAPLVAGNRRDVDLLRDDERRVYERVTDPDHWGHRRIEQERIPLTRAQEAVEKLVRQHS